MGASPSRSEVDDKVEEKVFRNESPISPSQDVVNHLESPETSSERQSTLDAIVRFRIQSELQRLKKEEEVIRQEIENELEKENLDRERDLVEDSLEARDGIAGRMPNSTVLMGDLEEIRSRVDKYQARRSLTEFPDVKHAGEAVVSCYRANGITPLDCWREVENFQMAVSQIERQHFQSL